ncbi:TnsD family Tn7-like transposition protein [Massilia solisilvae]|uniref:TnsD family Tn7-like transposition protein n=1 Tax=Massilia solisilvae TaxID=1811225 RepID=UPI00351D9F85
MAYEPDATRLVFFPPALPDETLHSQVARYHRLSGNLDDRLTLREVFGSQSLVATSLLPSHLRLMSSRLPERAETCADGLLEQGTIFPYYRPLLAPPQIARCLAAANSTDARGLKISLGMVAGRLGGQNPLRLCDQCVVEDRNLYGTPHWHRTHQLPGVLVCPRHECFLLEPDRAWAHLRRHSLFLPDAIPRAQVACPSGVENHHMPALIKLAQLSAQLLVSTTMQLPPDVLRTFYLTRAGCLGWLTGRGRIQGEVIDSMGKRCCQSFPDLPDFNFLRLPVSDVSRGAWILQLLRKQRRASAPIRHLTLLLLLGSSWNDLSKFCSCFTPRARKPERDVCISDSKLQSMQALVAMSRSGCSLREVSRQTGIAVTTLRIAAERAGLHPSKRPKKLKGTKLDDLKQDLFTTTSLDQIACVHGVALVSLYRILRADPALANRRETLLMEQERETRRKRFNDDRQKMPARRATDYAWLYRNDHTWLQGAIRSTIPAQATTRRERVNWAARDQNFAQQVRSIAERLYRDLPPVRVSRTRIIRLVGRQALIEKFMHRLPLTTSALREVAESAQAYSQRRASLDEPTSLHARFKNA